MRPPDAARPSGDRTIARMLLRAVAAAGHNAAVASRVRSYMAEPADRNRFRTLQRQADDEIRRLIDEWGRNPPGLGFTCHLFHKAPNLIGPPACRAAGLPYLVAEASFAPKRAAGPWAGGHERVRDAIGLADHVFFLNPHDEAGVPPLLKPRATRFRLPPVVCIQETHEPDRRRAERRRLAAEWTLPPEAVWAVAVGMMRPRAKLVSYRRLAQAWTNLADAGAHLLVVGAGESNTEVRRLFSDCAAQVSFLGMLQSVNLNSVYRSADIFIWPGIQEAVGMATLEAMAAGLPVAVGPWGSVAQDIEPGATGLVARTGDEPAQAVRRLIAGPELRRRLGAAAQARILRRHSLPVAAKTLTAMFEDVAGRTR